MAADARNDALPMTIYVVVAFMLTMCGISNMSAARHPEPLVYDDEELIIIETEDDPWAR